MKTALYTRVSTAAQAEEGSYGLDAQRNACLSFASRNGLNVVEEYCDDGYSGASGDRPALSRMRVSVARGEYEVVLVARLDRLSRDIGLQVQLVRELDGLGAQLADASEGYMPKRNAQTTLNRNMRGVFAQYDKEQLCERLMSGRQAKAAKGGYPGGRVPLGYRVANRELVIVEEEAAIVRRVFELRAQPGNKRRHMSYRTIASIVNEEGHRSKRGKPFSGPTIFHIIQNEDLYRGRVTFRGENHEGKHAAILPDQ